MSDRTARILYVAPDPALTLDQQGGAGTHMRGTIEALRACGYTVETAVGAPPGHGDRPTSAQRPAPAPARRLPAPVRLLARDLRLLAHGRAFRGAAFPAVDCVYERSAYLLEPGLRLARAWRVPYVVETDGILVETRAAAYGASLRRLGERIERRKIAAADLVVVMSEASRRDVVDRYGVPASRVLVKGLGVEASLRRAGPRPEPRFDVGYAGTFQPYHGLPLLVGALARLPERSALLVGDGPGRRAIEAEAADRGLAVEITGLLPREEALARLEECRVLVIPESADTIYPVKLLEYASLGRAVVCPRRAAFDEFARDGVELVFGFRPGDADDLARAIDEAARLPGEERADALARLVAQDYTWDAVGRRLAGGLHALGVAPGR